MKTSRGFWLIFGMIAVGAIITACLCLRHSLPVHAAPADSSWQSGELRLETIRTLPAQDVPPYSVNGNRDCLQQTITTRPSRLSPTPLAAQSHATCVVSTLYGAVSTSGYLSRPGTELYGLVKTISGQNLPLIAIPHQDIGISVTGAASGGTYLNIVPGFSQTLSSAIQTDGQVVITSSLANAQLLHDASGAALPVQTDSLSYSPNGQWLLVDLPAIGMARVNLATLEVLPFGEPVKYGTGSTPSYQTAITSDGRYAAVASRSLNRFRVYDLASCVSVPAHIIASVACQYRDILPTLATKIAGFSGAISTVRFINPNVLSLFAVDGQAVTRQYRLMNPDGQFGRFQYLALGDSFTSGEGAYSYKPSTDTSDNHCHLSQVSYPYLLGYQRALTSFGSVACSGAHLDDIVSTDPAYLGQANPLPRSQRNSTLILNSLEPGAIAQREFVSQYTPSVVTLSIGGNDFGFGSKLKRCLMADTCYASYGERLGFVRELHNLYYTLSAAYQDLLRSNDPKTQWYVVGYPQLAYPDGNCGVNVLLNHSELELTTHLITDLNATISRAAAHAGLRYIDIENALTGHRLCEAQGSNIAVNGLTGGDDFISSRLLHGPIGNESYHPNAYGQSLLAAAITKQIASFDEPPIAPQPTLEPLNDASSRLLNTQPTPSTIPTIARPIFDDMIYTATASAGTKLALHVDAKDVTLTPLSPVQLSLEPTNTQIGTAQTDSAGSLTTSAQLPNNIADGFYVLHATGTTTAGEAVDIYQDIQIISPASPPAQAITTSLQIGGTASPSEPTAADTAPTAGSMTATIEAGPATATPEDSYVARLPVGTPLPPDTAVLANAHYAATPTSSMGAYIKIWLLGLAAMVGLLIVIVLRRKTKQRRRYLVAAQRGGRGLRLRRQW